MLLPMTISSLGMLGTLLGVGGSICSTQGLCPFFARQTAFTAQHPGKPMRKKDVFMTKAKLRKLIRSGRSAIEHRMLGVLIKPGALEAADHAEMEQLTALLMTYNELMAVHEQPKVPSITTHDRNGGKE